jgi:hypothetical protein
VSLIKSLNERGTALPSRAGQVLSLSQSFWTGGMVDYGYDRLGGKRAIELLV